MAFDDMPPRALLFVAHPGHELLLLEWMRRRRPVVCVLTDGSGGAGRPRLEETRRVIEGAGARVGGLFGVGADKRFYAALLRRDAAFFQDIVDRLAAELRRGRIGKLVSDAVEHFNPVHDLCSAMACIAAGRLAHEGQPIERFCLPIEHRPATPAAGSRVISLSSERLREKAGAISAYAGLAEEATRYFSKHGPVLAEEILQPVDAPCPLPPPSGTPYYEVYGRRRVQQARYAELITYRDHLAPMVSALLDAEAARAAA